MTSSSVPLLSSTLSGITSTYPILPSFPHEKTHTIGELQSTLPLYTGTNPYASRRDLPLPQSRATSPHQSFRHEGTEKGSIFQEGEGSLQDLLSRSRKSSASLPETEGKQSVSEQKSSGGSMRDIGDKGSCRLTVEERPFTTPMQAVPPAPRDSPTRNTSTGSSMGEAQPPRQSPPSRPQTLPQLTTPITIMQAFYLLSTGKLVQVPSILIRVTLGDLFNHFQKELLEDPDWAVTPAGMDYSYYGYNYILEEEATHFACTAYNMIHHNHCIEVPARYQRPQTDLPPITFTPEPMDDEPPVPPPRAAVPNYLRWESGYAPVQPSYAYPCGYGPPGSLLPQSAVMAQDHQTFLRYLTNHPASCSHQAVHLQVDHCRHRLLRDGCCPDIHHHQDRQIPWLHGFLMQPT